MTKADLAEGVRLMKSSQTPSEKVIEPVMTTPTQTEPPFVPLRHSGWATRRTPLWVFGALAVAGRRRVPRRPVGPAVAVAAGQRPAGLLR